MKKQINPITAGIIVGIFNAPIAFWLFIMSVFATDSGDNINAHVMSLAAVSAPFFAGFNRYHIQCKLNNNEKAKKRWIGYAIPYIIYYVAASLPWIKI